MAELKFIVFDVTHYNVGLPGFPGRTGVPGQTVSGSQSSAVIRCIGKYEGVELRLHVVFIPPGESMPDNEYDKRNGWLYRPSSDYAWYLDLLRNEEPIRARINEARPFSHWLGTRRELVGEGEVTK